MTHCQQITLSLFLDQVLLPCITQLLAVLLLDNHMLVLLIANNVIAQYSRVASPKTHVGRVNETGKELWFDKQTQDQVDSPFFGHPIIMLFKSNNTKVTNSSMFVNFILGLIFYFVNLQFSSTRKRLKRYLI